MSDVKRYASKRSRSDISRYMVQSKKGDYVKYKAYQALEAENARLKKALKASMELVDERTKECVDLLKDET